MTSMDVFDGVDLGPDTDLDALVEDQLLRGTRRGPMDAAPQDWLARLWNQGTLSGPTCERLALAVHRALGHADPRVRARAVRLLLDCRKASFLKPPFLLDLAARRLELFEGLRDEDGRDLGETFVKVVATLSRGPAGSPFRRRAAFHRELGIHVLPMQCREEPEWVVEHARELAGEAVDPGGFCAALLIEALEGRPDDLRRVIENLGAEGWARAVWIGRVVRRVVRDQGLRESLLASLPRFERPTAASPWMEIFAEPPPSLLVLRDSGSAYAPDDPFGRCLLTVSGDGRLSLENWRAAWDAESQEVTLHREWTGRTDDATLRRLWDALAASCFPEDIPHVVPPGATLTLLTVRDRDREARVELDHGFALDQPGYAEAYRLLDALEMALSDGEIALVAGLETLPVRKAEAEG